MALGLLGPLMTGATEPLWGPLQQGGFFFSPSGGFGEIGCSKEERRDLFWVLLYITIAIEMGIE